LKGTWVGWPQSAQTTSYICRGGRSVRLRYSPPP